MKGSEYMYSAIDARETPEERELRYVTERDSIHKMDVVTIVGAFVLVVSVVAYAFQVIM